MFKVEREPTFIDGVVILRPSVFEDLRGKAWTFFDHKESGINHLKVVTNKRNVLRGIHYDQKTLKRVTVVSGTVQQVCVDLRVESPTYLKHLSVVINADDAPIQVEIPPGVGNAFKSLTDSVYVYGLSYEGEYSDAADQNTAHWNDSRFGIDWKGGVEILSNRDKLS